MYAEIENIHAMAKIIKEGRQELIVRILESKGFVSHKAYGRTYEYFPLVAKEEYTGTYMRTVLDNFFDGSVSRMVNFFSSQQSISTEETDEILRILKSGK